MLGRLRRDESAADLMPVVDISDGVLHTVDGRIALAFRCTPADLAGADDEIADGTSALFTLALGQLPIGARLVCHANPTPLSGEEWVPRHIREEYDPPPHLRPAVAIIEHWLRARLADGHVDAGEHLWTLSLRGAGGAGSIGGVSLLRPDARRHAERVKELRRAATRFAAALEDAGITSDPLGDSELVAIFWAAFNDPKYAGRVAPPELDGFPDRTDPEEDAARLREWRCLRERVAQTKLVRRSGYLRIHRDAWVTHALRAMPALTTSGWMHGPVTAGVRGRIALAIEVLDKAAEMGKLDLRRRGRHALMGSEDDRSAAPDLLQQEEHQELADLYRELASSEERVYDTMMIYSAWGAGPDDAEDAVERFDAALGRCGGSLVDRLADIQDIAWQATLPCGYIPPLLRRRLFFPALGRNLGDTLPWLGSRPGTPTGPVVGFAESTGAAVQLDPRYRDLANSLITLLGKPGGGKTHFALGLGMTTACRREKVVVMDRSTGHYDDFIRLVAGDEAVYYVDTKGSVAVNPWDLPPGARGPDDAALSYLLRLHRPMLGERRGGNPPDLTVEEAALLGDGFKAVYAAVRDRTPLERDLDDYLRAWDGELAASLARRLAPFVRGGLWAPIADRETTFDLTASAVVINFAPIEDDEAMGWLMPLFTEPVTRVARREPTTLLIDEFWYFLQHPLSAAAVAKQTRQGRHIQLVRFAMSQFLDEFFESAAGRAALKGSSVKVALEPGDDADTLDDFQRALSLSDAERRRFASLRAVKGSHAGAYLHISALGAQRGFVSLEAPPEFRYLFASNPEERELRARAVERNDGDLWAALDELVRTNGRLPDDEDGGGLRVLRGGRR